MLSKNEILMELVAQFPASSHKIRYESIDVDFGITNSKEYRLVSYPSLDKYTLIAYKGKGYSVISQKVKGFKKIVEFFKDNFELAIFEELKYELMEWID